MLKRRRRCHGSDNVAHALGRPRRGVEHVVVQEQSQHPPATAAVPRQHVPPQRHAQQQLPAPCTLRSPLSRRAKENICQEATVLPPPRAEDYGPLRTRRRTSSRHGAQPCSCGQTRGVFGGRSRHQMRHRWCPGIRMGHEQWPISREMATNNGPFRSMGQRNGPFPENGLEQWPISRRWQTGVAHVAQTARRLRQARRQREPQPGSAMTCCAPRTYPLHPDATVVATDYRPAVVGATSRQRQPCPRCPCWAKDWRSAFAGADTPARQ